jgi:hypothetical protein
MASAPASITALRVTVFEDGKAKQAASSKVIKAKVIRAVVVSNIVNSPV